MVATFEVGRAPLIEAARQWKGSRFWPLYAAGLFAGAGIGLAAASFLSSPGDYTEPAVAQRPVVYDFHGAALEIPAFVTPALPPGSAGIPIVDGPPADVILPGDPLLWSLRPEPAAEPVAPTVAEAPAAAPVQQPAAAPVQQPAPAQPEPAQPPSGSLPQVQPAPPAAQPEPEPAPAAQPEPAPPAKPNFYVPEVSHAGLNSMEQRFLDAANAERIAAGMAPLTLEHGLTIIARTRSQQLIDQDYFGHRDPYGYSMYVELLALHGYTTYAWAGENLAMNNYAESESPERAVAALMKSPTHKRNILATEFSRIGVGLATMADGRKYYTMIFLS